MGNKVYIFGEMHTKEERDAIEYEIRKLRSKGFIDFLLTEEIGPNKALTIPEMKRKIEVKQYSISDRSLLLGIELNIPVIGIDNWDGSTYSSDKKKPNGDYENCVYSFRIRESTMTDKIKEYRKKGNCAVIVGDSHLRGLFNPVMGGPSKIIQTFLCDPDIIIHRSPTGELNEKGIVEVDDTFLNRTYDVLVALGNELIEDQAKYESTPYHKKSAINHELYTRDYFESNEVSTFCKVIENDVVSMVRIKFTSPKDITIGPIFTKKDYRGKGLVTSILQHIFSQYPKDKFAFSLGVMPGNKEGITLYEKFGFKPIHIHMGL